MKKDNINNIRIVREKVLITPEQLKQKYPLTAEDEKQITSARQTITDILGGKDPRLLVVCGPCSIHDIDAAIAYGGQLKKLADDLKDTLFIVMRVYFEKPRTTIGWKGLINDPHMDNSFDIETGFHMGRELLLTLSRMGLPLASEALDPNSPQYLADLFSWVAIGARTTESQTHREMASGLSMPIGFKNGTDGGLAVAINAMQSASMPHHFVGISQKGQVCLLETQGNPYGHVILRGGKTPNYDPQSIAQCEEQMVKAGLLPKIMIDCSHANSNKDYRRQPIVARSVIDQIIAGNTSIMGIMLESHLNEGNQSADLPLKERKYGVSVTDACINWQTTEVLLRKMAEDLNSVLIKQHH